MKTTLKLEIYILWRYRNFISVQEDHQQASPVSWDYPFNFWCWEINRSANIQYVNYYTL
jgi:hypothetical protein